MPRVLGVDIGKARIGLAVSDPEGITAQPLEVLEGGNPKTVAERARELDVDEIVVGIPLRLDGTRGPEVDAAETFAQLLEVESSLPVHRWDERLSTVEAERTMRSGGMSARKQRGVVDKVAAALILGAYLESRRTSR